MNIRDLNYLIALGKEHNFRKAAEKCHVSQPTLSAQIKKLEEELGLQLIERSHKQARLTEAGQQALVHALAVHEEVQQLKSMAEEFKNPYAGTLKLGLIPTIAPYLLPKIIKPLRQEFPQLGLVLHEAQTEQLLIKLRNFELDLLVLALPLEDKLEGLRHLPLYDEPFYLAVHRSQIESHIREINYHDLDTSKIALLEEGHCLRAHALEICQLAQGQGINEFTATSLETLRYMVEANEVMTLIPALAVEQKTLEHTNVRYIPFKAPAPTRHIGLVFRASQQRKELFQAVQKLIQSNISHDYPKNNA